MTVTFEDYDQVYLKIANIQQAGFILNYWLTWQKNRISLILRVNVVEPCKNNDQKS